MKTKQQATFTFDRKIAKRFHDIRYFKVMGYNSINMQKLEKLKNKLTAPKREIVKEIRHKYKRLGQNNIAKVNKMLKQISNKNAKLIFDKNITEKEPPILKETQTDETHQKEPPAHTNLMKLICSIPLLIQSYTKIRKNKGILTAGAGISPGKWKNMPIKAKNFDLNTRTSPDGIQLKHFFQVSELLKKEIYPWGVSKRIDLPKPGSPKKQRPITIPPFMDKVIQQSIKSVLESIYEPWFDKANCSFGFRPNKGTHNAITSIRSLETNHMHLALEGDIEGAYDNVNKDILLKILEKRIKDRKFINMIKQRLKYTFFTSENNFETPIKAQGGIDSPYLFNIYLKSFDNAVQEYLKKEAELMNQKIRKNKWIKERTLSETAKTTYKEVNKLREIKRKLRKSIPKTEIKQERYSIMKKIQKIRHIIRKAPSQNRARAVQRFHYVRYADDWIILSNCSIQTLERVKSNIKSWLKTHLDATLSEEKTLITDLRKKNANFLGFQIKYSDSRKLQKKYISNKGKFVLSKVAGFLVTTFPDSQRLINRMFMKGYCDKNGFPLSIPWLSCMEPSMIINKYNSVIYGLANYYTEFISRKRTLSRWIYILRFSCLKTLAQKYKSSIRKIFKKYKTRDLRNGKTIQIKLKISYRDEEYEKKFTLTTYKEATQKAFQLGLADKFMKEHKKLSNKKSYLNLEKYMAMDTNNEGFPSILDSNYLDRITWINWRTSCSFDMPCTLCGSFKNVQMHHTKHVKKNTISLIPNVNTWEKLMGLRNRKQIPVCSECHINRIHSGKYSGKSIKELQPIYNSHINTESYISIAPDNMDRRKTMKEKGLNLIKP